MTGNEAHLESFEQRALMVGAMAALLTTVGAFFDAEQFFRSYLTAFCYWIAIPLGSLALLMLHHIAGGAWSLVIRRPSEAAARTFPLMAVLLVPVLFGLHELYEWTHADVVAADHILQQKSAYLNVPFFLARSALYFAIWIAIGTALSKLSARHDDTGDDDAVRLMRRISGGGIALLALTITFASVDWVMSLDPHWFSTLFGFMFLSSDILATLAFSICVLVYLKDREPFSRVLNPQHFHDLGNLLMGFVMVWAYLSFSQYLIIWSGNLQEEVGWYLDRNANGWQAISVLLAVFHFFVPFLVLLTRHTKRAESNLVKVAGFMLLMRWIDLHWIITPSLSAGAFTVHWMDFTTVVALGGLWLAYFARQLRSQPLLPKNDPLLEAAMEPAGGH